MTAVETMPRRAFAVWWKDLEKWVMPSNLILRRSLPPDWKRVHISEIVRVIDGRVKVEAEKEYKMAGVKWYGEGVFHRETVRGDTQSAKYLSPLVPGALIYNRLFAWKESFAVVPPELADCFVSSEFPQFMADAKLVLPDFLYLFCLRDSTIRAVNAASTGSAAVSRNRFKEEEFLNFEISLPPLAEQKAIVARWCDAQTEIAAARARVEKSQAEIQRRFLADLGFKLPATQIQPRAFAVWWKDIFSFSPRATFLTNSIGSLNLGKYPVARGVDCLAEVRHGCSASPSPKPTDLEILKISAATRGEFAPTEKKFAFDNKRVREEFNLQNGDVLMCRTNGTLAYVGMSALVRENMANLVFPDKLIRVRAKKNITPEFLWFVLQSHPLRAQIEAAARTAVGNYAIGTDDIWNFQIPLPPLPVQREIMARVASGRAEITRERAAAETLSKKIEADVEAMILGTKK